MWCFRLVFLVVTFLATATAHNNDFDFKITDEQYYQFPRLFHLDDYEECLSQKAAVYCLGSFQLQPATAHNQLYDVMQRYSANWMDRFNHTRLHRGLCVSRRCPAITSHLSMEDRFSICVNESTVEKYSLTSQLYQLQYCRGEDEGAVETDVYGKVFAGVVALILGLTLLSTAADLLLPDHTKKDSPWMVSYSIRVNWRSLTHDPNPGPLAEIGDLRVCDGLRAFSMICVVMEHVCWITTTTYQMNPRFTELTRRELEALLLSNSTLLVQVFFLLASFLLAHKLLQQSKKGPLPKNTFFSTICNRLVRISPAYWVVVGFAATWWSRLGGGPMWAPLVDSEAQVCRDKWWAQLFYLNNVVDPDHKCLIQTWYLAADMQLYAVALVLTLVVPRRVALPALGALWVLAVGTQAVLAYLWDLQPTYIIHNPEAVRASYLGDASFNWLYQSALGNLPGTLMGLLLAHTHHALLDHNVDLRQHKWAAWITAAGAPSAFLWVLLSPLLGTGAPLAATDRPVFGLLVALALLGSFHNVHTPWRTWLSWSGWRLPARLSFSVLLLHMLLNKLLVAQRTVPTHLTRLSAVYEWGAVYVLSYLAAIPFSLLVEMPPSRLYRALGSTLGAPRRAPAGGPHKKAPPS